MKRILIANEFGGGRGHLDATNCLLRAIGGRAKIRVIAQPAIARQLPGASILPPWPDPKHFEASTLWETLEKMGAWHPENLAPRLAAYWAIFDDLAPDLVIGDYAPVAMLMARALGCQTIAVGSPFFTPDSSGQACSVPDGTPITWPAESADAAATALLRLGVRLHDPIESAIAGQSQWVRSLPELDPLSGSPNRFLVRPDVAIKGDKPHWPEGNARIACYLRPSDKRIPVIDTLVDRIDGAAICSSGPAEEIDRWGACVHTNPAGFDSGALLREADVIVHNGGAGLCRLAALSGTPQILMPRIQEHLLNATLVQKHGWGSVHTSGMMRLARDVRAALGTRIANPPSDPSLPLSECILSEISSGRATAIGESA